MDLIHYFPRRPVDQDHSLPGDSPESREAKRGHCIGTIHGYLAFTNPISCGFSEKTHLLSFALCVSHLPLCCSHLADRSCGALVRVPLRMGMDDPFRPMGRLDDHYFAMSCRIFSSETDSADGDKTPFLDIRFHSAHRYGDSFFEWLFPDARNSG